jgi:hypothetical protein
MKYSWAKGLLSRASILRRRHASPYNGESQSPQGFHDSVFMIPVGDSSEPLGAAAGIAVGPRSTFWLGIWRV